jgi:hypothetical protein
MRPSWLLRAEWTSMRDRRPRLIVVRQGAVELHDQLTTRYKTDPRTRIIWDRRNADGVKGGVEPDRPRRGRRFPQDRDILTARGFFVARTGSRRTRAA